MNVLWLILIVLVLGVVGFFVAVNRAKASAGGDSRRLHSRLSYYGTNAFILTVVPALILTATWSLLQPLIVDGMVQDNLPKEILADPNTKSLAMSDVRRLAAGLDLAVSEGAMTEEMAGDLNANFSDVRGRLGEIGVALGAEVQNSSLKAAQEYRAFTSTGRLMMTVLILAVAIGGLYLSIRSVRPEMRARNMVERSIMVLLIGASTIAILTTFGIVMSMLFETFNFFGQYAIGDFFFGTTWSPNFRGDSDLGIIPLLWGTLYVSLIALLVAVPIGLFAAVYMAEYASPRLRGIVKPALEVLAGIPTIVYGLFALVTVGPLLVSVFGEGGLNFMQSASSVMTAGLVMGIMLIPFVSSLSDDIITAVPQAMRDGSLGLGATPSETIRSVVLPAALPGIVGAVLLAASRAIGETMIVVLGAGAAARLSLNPFEAMTTVTVKIVSQLTGDTDFASPETLVAFALGLTLFVVTLGLNILAQYIVKKYREQYE